MSVLATSPDRGTQVKQSIYGMEFHSSDFRAIEMCPPIARI